MTVLERKKYLKAKIDNTFDEEILEKVEKLLSEEQAVYKFTPEQLAQVKEAQAQYERGEYLTDEEAQKEIDEWFEAQEKLFIESSEIK